MKWRLRCFSFAFVVLVSGCATYPQDPERQARYHVDTAQAQFSKGNTEFAGAQIDVALERPNGNRYVQEWFDATPRAKTMYQTYLEGRVARVLNLRDARELVSDLERVESAGVLGSKQIADLRRGLVDQVVSGNRRDTIKILLSDDTSRFPDLNSRDHQKIIFDRTVQQLQGSDEPRPIKELFAYIEKAGRGSNEWKTVESALPSFHIRRSELDVVASLFPSFADQRAASLTRSISLEVKNADRLFADDLQKELKSSIKGVKWVSRGEPKSLTLVIDRVRHKETAIPDSAETVIYAQHQVNLVAAALLMPRNASYIYEVVKAGATVDYGYVVTLSGAGKVLSDDVVRGRLESTRTRCQNARIQNVFGGTTSADFIANDDMQNRCAGSQQGGTDDLNAQLVSKIVEGVLNVPEIKAVHLAN
ncbi:hypothetical protein [Zoogloea sp.]|uniref:hypothetical protein n=1 Tax=Zoogloea sp. TaxID=49181 RepID=UPI0035B26D6F